MLKRDMNIADYDAELFAAIQEETARQEEHIELIASENLHQPTRDGSSGLPVNLTSMPKATQASVTTAGVST